MASIVVRHRACSSLSFRLMRQNLVTQGNSYGTLVMRNFNLCLQLNSRLFSAAGSSSNIELSHLLTIAVWPACAYFPRLPRGRRSRTKEETTDRGKDILTQAQEDLEKAAKDVIESDKPIIKKLGHDASFDIYVKLMLSRLRPFLFYFVLLGPEQFLKGYGPPASSLARGRNATVFLFISAHAWLFHALAALSSRSPDFPPEMVQIAEKFATAGKAVEAYVENKLPEGMGWAEVGGAILDSSSDAWLVLSKTVGWEDGTTAASVSQDPLKKSPDKGGNT